MDQHNILWGRQATRVFKSISDFLALVEQEKKSGQT